MPECPAYFSYYDARADVLYLSLGFPARAVTVLDTHNGIEWRYATSNHQPCGATVLHYAQWKRTDLHRQLAAHLNIPLAMLPVHPIPEDLLKNKGIRML